MFEFALFLTPILLMSTCKATSKIDSIVMYLRIVRFSNYIKHHDGLYKDLPSFYTIYSSTGICCIYNGTEIDLFR